LLLNGLIQPFQQPERVLGFFNACREGKRATKRTLMEIAVAWAAADAARQQSQTIDLIWKTVYTCESLQCFSEEYLRQIHFRAGPSLA
jgi:hypothetical protein